ncbi:O-antigen polysaccharide polymerase Wzy [Bacteroides graminisolvens]|uniref:O-antigen polysaccharide polymerase Wzy n=2 Tax=Bacteroides graminisolvens TaxID=477666 RepID=UPI00137867E0|nr:O-antigen polysaccharide polymerase Wzy [Bacteroides graminisolvens]
MYLIEYVAQEVQNWSMPHLFEQFDLLLAVIFSFWYMIKYRKDNILCFELMFLPVFLLGIFYSDIVLAAMNYSAEGIGGAFNNAIKQTNVLTKSRVIQMLALCVFLLGCVKGNVFKSNENIKWKIEGKYETINYKAVIHFLAVLLLLEIILNYLNGNFSTWFSYGQGLSDSERSKGLGRIDFLCLISTIVEFVRLGLGQVLSFKDFLHKVNKIYLFEILLVSSMLLLSGNRNEMLLVFLPFIISYHVFVRHIPNKNILLGLAVGVMFMIYSGLTRQGNAVSYADLDVYTMSRDYSLVGINCDYLVKYTDAKGPHLFASLPASLLGAIPYIGPLIFNTLNLDLAMQSTYITTEGLATWQGTGLGTSIVGDLYYNAKLPFVILFMAVFGYFISRMHVRFQFERRFSLLYYLTYLYMTSNAVYFVRQQWDFPVSRILYDYIILIIIFFFFNKHKSYS